MVSQVNTTNAFIEAEIEKSRIGLAELGKPQYRQMLADIADIISNALRAGGKILFCGNGGSAADSQHLAAELVGRQNFNRDALAGVSLTVDTSCLTAIGNDYGYENVFSRQVEAIGVAGDVLIGISTSGRSPNVVNAIKAAKKKSISTVAFTGSEARDMGIADCLFPVPASETPKIQELHIVGGHIIFGLVEQTLFPRT